MSGSPATTLSGDHPRPDVFVSYASEDRRRATAIVSALEVHGYVVWWDRELQANEAFSPVIEQQLDAARAVVVLWSTHSVEKRFVREEAVRGQDRLIPALLDDARIPLGFGQASSVDLRRWRGDELALELDPLIQNVARLTGREPEPRPWSTWLVARSVYLDLKTRIVLPVLLAVFASAWLLRGPDRWRREDLQWSLLLLLLACVAWLALRAGRFARSAVWRQLARVGLAGAAVAWVMGVRAYYEPPHFDAERTGVMVARFEADDLDNGTQRTWVDQLLEERERQRGTSTMRQALDPVDVAVLHRLIAADGQARALAARSRALIVLWGRRQGRTSATFADLPGFAKQESPALANVGTVALGQHPAQALARPVVLFASAYGAFARSDFEMTRRLLGRVEESLRAEGDSLASAGAAMLATTYLLLGNTYFLEGCAAGHVDACVAAIDHYQSALETFAPDETAGNLFVEASNNLAVAEAKLTGGFETSVEVLQDAALACRSLAAEPPLACSFVTFNQAVAASAGQRYDEALAMLAQVCGDKTLVARGLGAGSLFPSACRQQQAYAAAKLGESAQAHAEATRRFDEAARFADQALAQLPPAAAGSPPPRIAITRGRIAFARGEYQRAIELLAPFLGTDAPGVPALTAAVARAHPELDGPEIGMLYAAARVCSGAMPREAAPLPEQLGAPARDYFTRRLDACAKPKER